VIIFHDGWYYLLVTDRACSAGANSDCNIRIGRSRRVTGPFVDNMGIEMLPVGGELFGAAGTSAPITSDSWALLGSDRADEAARERV